MTCYLVRHGKDDESVRGGWSNSSLTTEGRRQVECLAAKIKAEKSIDIGMIYTSDLQRAMETAEILSSELVVPFVCVSDFREVNNGIFSGMSNQMASEKYPHLYWNILDWDEAYPQGESPHQFYKRIYKAWYDF